MKLLVTAREFISLKGWAKLEHIMVSGLDVEKIMIDFIKLYIKDTYVLVEWPETQQYITKDWFNSEAILSESHLTKSGKAAYFIPTERIIKVK
jgi:hypothetical protein